MDEKTHRKIAGLRAKITSMETAEIKAVREMRVNEVELLNRRRKEKTDSFITARLADKTAKLDATRTDLINNRKDLSDQLGTILEGAFTSAQELASQVDSDVPIALFPLKLETRFFRKGRSHELRVRIFPDQIAISAFQEALSEAEVKAGRTFWRDCAAAGAEKDPTIAQEAAAEVFAKRTEGNRTLWIALETRPRNWPDRANAKLPDPDDLDFPNRKNAPTNNAATASLLPDQFVVELYNNGRLIHSATTVQIKDKLLMGPDAEGVLARIERDKDKGNITTTDNLKWLFDYDDAVKAGMAVSIPITASDRARGFDQVLALGLRFSEGAKGGAALLQNHLRDLRFSTGLDILPNGTPTNNTEDAATGFDSGQHDGAAEVLRLARNATPSVATNYRDKRDGQRLAEAFGLTEDALANLCHAEQNDIGEALSMNRALWSATLGGYMRDFLSPLRGGSASRTADSQLASRITRFGTDFVTGRGLLPSIRVGKQPYGILITSDYRDYDADDRPLGTRSPHFPLEIKPLMDDFTELFRSFEAQLKAIGRDGDPEETLTNILGLHASSTTYQSRKGVSDGVSWNNLSMQGFDRDSAIRLFDIWNSLRTPSLTRIGLNGSREISELMLLSDTDDLTGPVVDDDPNTPLSEDTPIRAFDGANNYIDWLLGSTPEVIRTQKFTDENGDTVTRPRALLYKYLRHATLAEIAEQSSKFVAALPDSKVTRVDGRSAISAADSTMNELKLPDDAALAIKPKAIGLDVQSSSIGDFLVGEARKRPSLVFDPAKRFTLPIAELKSALGDLSDLPTARLERLFAEHMDTLYYRLDAWHSGMFASRLNTMRETRKKSTGVMVGAYGYLENLKARPEPTLVPKRDVPAGILPDETTRVVARPDNGGFVHAPSQAHAVTAAVLRNGYLTHADRDEDSRFAINLDSSRVRKALYLVEGLRHNQSMSSLLGYRLERGLHENHSGLELDAFIYALRQRFPLTSKRIVDVEASASAEVVEARNVIDGYDLIQHAAENAYPWGISDLPSRTSHEGRAILQEVDEIEDLFDAYGDLMMAESVHQAVNGNMERASGALQSISNGDVPPMPEVAETPRSGTVINQTVIVRFPSAKHWTKTDRSGVNDRMNGWLVDRLPDPDKVALGFRLDGGPQKHMSLSKSGLDALDVVLMATDQLGDGSSTLERWLVDRYRVAQGIPDDTFVRFSGGPPAPVASGSVLEVDTSLAPNGAHALDAMLPLLMELRRIVTKARNAHALDARLPTEVETAQVDNPKGLRLSGGEPLARADLSLAFSRFDDYLQVVNAYCKSAPRLAAFEALQEDASAFDANDWTGLEDVRTAMRALWHAGHAQAEPRHATGLNATIARDMFEQAILLDQALTPHRNRAFGALEIIPDTTADAGGSAAAQLLDKRAKALNKAAKAMFTDSFQLTHEYMFEGEQRTELQPALDAPIETDPLKIEAWLQGLVRLRPTLYSLSIIQDWSEWLGKSPETLTPVQLPRVAGDPWVGGSWKAGDTVGERLALMMVGPDMPASAAQAGLVLDSFAEKVPTKSEVTGLSFHYDRPNAEPPQAVLLAVPPSIDKGWSWEALRGTVLDTFTRARLRAVEPDHLISTDYFQVLPANLVPFSQGVLISTFLASNSITAFETQE